MARKNLKHQIIAGLSTTLLLGMLVVNPVFSREEANTSTQPTTTISQPEAVTAKAKDGVVTLKDDKVYQTANASFEETLDISQEDWSKLTWTFGNEKHGVKPIAEWKTWLQQENGGFVGEPMFEISGTNTQLKITYHSMFGEKVDKRWPVNARRTYRNYIGDYELKGTSADGKVVVKKKITIRPYESFKTHEEMLQSIEESRSNAHAGRQVTIETIGVSAHKNDMKMGIVAENQAAIDDYLNHITPEMLKNPDKLLAELKAGKLNYKLPIFVHNTHADEQPGIDIVTDLFRDFATKETISFQTLVGEGTNKENKMTKDVRLNIEELLKHFIFIFDFTENPDGDILNTRSFANGIDPNRDAGFQTNPETRSVITQINKWNPLALLDIHGYQESFLIEPATPPHDPNFELDLFASALRENAHAMGNAGIANSNQPSYLIPLEEFLKGPGVGNEEYTAGGWDDSSSGYTGVYAVYQGILGHTMEIPAANQDAYRAGLYGVLGSINYLNENRDRLFENKLNFFSRGIHKIETKDAENYLIGPDQKVVGRDKKGRDVYFPDYYVLPLTPSKDNDTDQAFSMVEYFKRNGVEVKELTKDIGDYKKGDLVIDMAQAKRGFANHILYQGTNESAWKEMYAEVIANFPDMRGFKAVPIFEKGKFDGALSDVSQSVAPRVSIDHNAPYYKVANHSFAGIKAINELIHEGKKVYTTEDGFIVSTSDFERVLAQYSIYGEPLYKKPVGEALKPIKVYAPGNPNEDLGYDSPSEISLSLKQMGFDVVDTLEEADAVILDNGSYDKTVLGKKPTMIFGGERALWTLQSAEVLPNFEVTFAPGYKSYEGLFNVTVDDKNPLASGYQKDDVFYSRSGMWISSIPEGFKPVITAKEKDHFISGWWQENEQVAGQVLAIEGKYENQPLFLYSGNPTNKFHTLHSYRWVSNFLWNKEHAKLEEIPESERPTTEAPTTHETTTTQSQTSTPSYSEVPSTTNNVVTVPKENTWELKDGQWIFKKADGSVAKKEWIKTGNKWYYVDENGVMVKNRWFGDYYVADSGAMALSEWIYDTHYGSWFYVKEDGSFVENDWIQTNGQWYYLNAGGYMAKNEWIYDTHYGSWFYVKEDGKLAQKEWIELNHKWYYLKSGGYMAKNEVIDGYKVNASGEWVK